MKKILLQNVSEKFVSVAEVATILILAIVPLFVTYPFRINIFLSWEGAYRMYLGQIPYKDFGIPLGYAYWMIPAMFFKLFGPYLASLVKAQVLINIISGFAFRSILKSVKIDYPIRFIGVFIFVVSYSFQNFWPWYNHTVIVFELAGIAFLLVAFKALVPWKKYVLILSSAIFLVLSFLTKQDGGFFAILIALVLVIYESVLFRNGRLPIIVVVSFFLSVVILIGSFIQYDFLYWFNYGQEPHYGRVSIFDILNEFFEKSLFLKFYLFLFALLILNRVRIKEFSWSDREYIYLLIISLGILGQAIVLQVTSYTPLDGNLYFHSFAVVFILANIASSSVLSRVYALAISLIFVLFWWSGTYWKYANRIVSRLVTDKISSRPDTKNIISINTYKLEFDSTALDQSTWQLSDFKSFEKVYMPKETIDGINRLKSLELFRAEGYTPKVLNMSELTPLAHELGFELEKGLPLWYHLNVSMFDKELLFFNKRVKEGYYDLVLFEVIPNLNNFYPNEVRIELKRSYELIDTFQAPRRKTTEIIEVYRKRVQK
jgi:hypothetical protein